MNLYEIADTYQRALVELVGNDDIPNEVIEQTMEAIYGGFEMKAIAVASFFENLNAEAEAIKHAEMRMKERRTAIESKSARLKAYLKENMERTGITKVSCPYFTVSIAANPPSVVIDDASLLPEILVRTKTTIEPDKAAIKKFLQENGELDGAHLETGTRLVLK